MASDGENIMIANEAEGFSEAVLRVLRDSRLRSRLEIAGRETAVSKYDWGIIGGEMLKAYRRLTPGGN